MSNSRQVFTHYLFLSVFILNISCCEDDGKPKTVKDIDGNEYHPVTIGTQVWMTENLKTTRYQNGDIIGTTTPATLDISLENNPKYQWAFDGQETNVTAYGRLYTWYAATDTRNVCPTGWHVPTDIDWTTLTTHLGGEVVAGGKLKETGTEHWLDPNTGATDEVDFTALPSGFRYAEGVTFYDLGEYSYWWSSTEAATTTTAWTRFLYYTDAEVGRNGAGKGNGFSVRCIQD